MPPIHPARTLGRAIRLKCPRCGGGPLFKHWLKMRDKCPVCGLRLERGESGYQVGSYMFNIVLSEMLFAAIFVVAVVWTWPSPPWDFLQFGGAGLMLVAPFALFPFCRTLFLACDLIIRPNVDTPDRPWHDSGKGNEGSGTT